MIERHARGPAPVGAFPVRVARSRVVSAILVAALVSLTSRPHAQRTTIAPADLSGQWETEHVSAPVSALFDHAALKQIIAALPSSGPIRTTQVGSSLEGREIWDVTFGTGATTVLMWSQMHGDEATATSTLIDLYAWIGRHAAEPAVRQLLAALTVHTVPMLNPDGAERWQRRNAQGLDLNRDALLLQGPESQLLKGLRDRLEPAVGFNLHNQNWRTSVGDPPQAAAISLLSVAGDEARTMTPGRVLTKKLGAVIRDALEPWAAGRMGRYDDSFEVRAFGDNLTKWGTPVLLIETGPWPAVDPDPMLVKLNFIALVTALQALADGGPGGALDRADPARYDSLPENDSRLLHTIIRNVTIITREGAAPFVGDVGLIATRRVRTDDGVRRLAQSFAIDDLGDLRTLGALFEVDGTGLRLAPAGATPLLPSQPADLVLTGPDGTVVRRFQAETVSRP